MKIILATKMTPNGWRRFLGIDTDKREFSRECSSWYGRSDIVEITAADRRKLIDKLTEAGFKEIDFMGLY